jgi:hypothetical protein
VRVLCLLLALLASHIPERLAITACNYKKDHTHHRDDFVRLTHGKTPKLDEQIDLPSYRRSLPVTTLLSFRD